MTHLNPESKVINPELVKAAEWMAWSSSHMLHCATLRTFVDGGGDLKKVNELSAKNCSCGYTQARAVFNHGFEHMAQTGIPLLAIVESLP